LPFAANVAAANQPSAAANKIANVAQKQCLPLLPNLPLFAPSLLLRGGLGWGFDSDDISDTIHSSVVDDFAAIADTKCTVKMKKLKNFATEGNPLGQFSQYFECATRIV